MSRLKAAMATFNARPLSRRSAASALRRADCSLLILKAITAPSYFSSWRDHSQITAGYLAIETQAVNQQIGSTAKRSRPGGGSLKRCRDASRVAQALTGLETRRPRSDRNVANTSAPMLNTLIDIACYAA